MEMIQCSGIWAWQLRYGTVFDHRKDRHVLCCRGLKANSYIQKSSFYTPEMAFYMNLHVTAGQQENETLLLKGRSVQEIK